MPRQPEEVGTVPPGGHKLAPGVVAKLHGLKGAAELNGLEVTVEAWCADADRWLVRLADGAEKRVKAENLAAKAESGSSSGEPAALKVGAAVRLCGLQGSAELNGTLGTCESWLPSMGRWLVRLESGHDKRVRPENLSAAEPGVSVLGRSGAAASLRSRYVSLARTSRPAAADDGCDEFVVADAVPAAGAAAAPVAGAAAAPAAGAVAAAAAARGPAAAGSGSRVEAPKAECVGEGAAGKKRPRAENGGGGQAGKQPAVSKAVWTGDRALEARKKRTREESPDPAEGTEVGEGLRCPGWLWEALYSHQQEGVRWLWNLHQNKQGGILADDLGLGKTVQTIGYLASLHHSGVLRKEASHGMLVVCPVTLMKQWQKEIGIWYPRLDVRVVHQLEEKARKDAFRKACGPQCVAITSYEMLKSSGSDVIEVPWAVVILDEGQKIRNAHGPGTLIAKTFNTPHRIVLTGSPVHNNLSELWSLMDFVRPGCLGTLPVFTEEIAKPIEAGSLAGVEPARAAAAYQTASALRELTKHAILRRTKPEVMESIQLPKKEEQVLLCHVTVEQYAAYLSFVQSHTASQSRSGSRDNRGNVCHAISLCRRLCNHPDFLIGESESSTKPPDMWNYERSGKMKVLVEAMRQWYSEGHRILVFVQTVRMLEVLGQLMDKLGYKHLRMDSRTPVNKRVRTIEDFNNDSKLFAMILTPHVGGVGLNIIGANRVVLFDPDWNPMTDVQARERAWRIGQRRDVGVFRLLLAGTLEEKIYKRQMAKQQLSQQVFSAGASPAFGRGGALDLFALPPVPPGVDERKLGQLKEKYKVLLKGHAPNEEAEDQDADIVQAVMELGGEAPATSKEASGGGGCALLQTLFERKGLRASFNGDSVERMLVDRRSVREGASALAVRAVAAIQRSVAAHANRNVNEPTWTGKFGTVGKPSKAGERQADGAASSCPTGGGNERPSKRSKGSTADVVSAEVMACVERLTKLRRGLSETQSCLAETIFTAFLDKAFAGPNHSLSTSQVLQHAAGRVSAEQRGAFKSLLQQTCTLSKPSKPEETGLWVLRQEFLPKAARQKVPVGSPAAGGKPQR